VIVGLTIAVRNDSAGVGVGIGSGQAYINLNMLSWRQPSVGAGYSSGCNIDVIKQA